MGPVELIILLSVIGFLLMAAEVFVPGLVLGILGTFCLIGAVVVAYMNFGAITGTFVFAAVGLLAGVGFVIWMSIFPRTSIGRRIMLQQSLTPGDGEKSRISSLVGRKGKALTPLRPSGTALIEGRKIDVVAEGELIPSGEEITVVYEEGLRVVVRKDAGRMTQSA